MFKIERDDATSVCPCTHEEADTRLLLHALDASAEGHKKVMLRTVETDVVVLSIAMVSEIDPDSFWIAFGVGKNLRYISAKNIAANLETLTRAPTEESLTRLMPLLELFVVLMYDRGSNIHGVNEARKQPFTRKSRATDNIPPTSAALYQHVKRVAYQAGFCWGQTLVASPFDWGWKKGLKDEWEPVWSVLSQASQTCQELLRCSCSEEKGCRGRCKCVKAEMLCTALCKCGGNCDRV